MNEAEQIDESRVDDIGRDLSPSPWDGTGTDPSSEHTDALDAWNAPPGAASRPTIRIQAGHLDEQATAALEAVARADLNLYQRSGQLVTIAREPSRTEGGPICEGRTSLAESCATCGSLATDPCAPTRRRGANILTRPGTPQMMTMTSAGVTRRAARFISWQKFDA